MANHKAIGLENTLTKTEMRKIRLEALEEMQVARRKAEEYVRKIFGDDLYEELERIEPIYAEIPFNSLEGKGEFKPLFEAKDRLPILRRKMDDLFVVKNEAGLGDLKSFVRELASIGLQYRANLIQTLNQIRSFP